MNDRDASTLPTIDVSQGQVVSSDDNAGPVNQAQSTTEQDIHRYKERVHE